jgi:O-antigen/teichoic acid export membrane protein
LLSTALRQGIGLVRFVITASLLAPSDFGVFGMAMAVFGVVNVFTDVGLRLAYVAHSYGDPEEESRWLHTVWTADLGLKVLLGLVLGSAAYPAALYFGDPRVFSLTLGIAIGPALRSLGSPGILRLEKAQNFGPLARMEVAIEFIAALATIASAYSLRSAWALVVGHLAGAVAGGIAAYLVAPVRPRIVIDVAVLRRVVRFGGPILTVRVLGALRVDSFVLGRLLGAAMLGSYTLACRAVEFPQGFLAGPIARTMLPFFSDAARSNAEISRAHLTSVRMMTWAIGPIFMPMLFFPDLLVSVLGSKWAAAVPILRFTAIAGIARSLSSLLTTLLIGVREPKHDASTALVESAVLFGTLLATVPQFGLAAAGWCLAAQSVLGLLLRCYWLGRVLRQSWSDLLGAVAMPVAAHVCSALAGALLLLASAPGLLALIGMLACSVVLALLLEPTFGALVRTFVQERRGSSS